MAYDKNKWRTTKYAKQPVQTADNVTIPEVQKIEKNYEKFLSLASSIQDEKVKKPILEMLTELKGRIAVAPASTKTEFVGAYAGGLVQSSLLTLKTMIQINDALQANISRDDLIVAGLFYHLGKIGNLDQEYYVAQESQWHIDRGMRYEINKQLDGIMPPNMRSIWWLNNAGVPLSEDVMYAIYSLSTMNGSHVSSLDTYQAPKLAIILQTAFRLICSQASETEKKSVLD